MIRHIPNAITLANLCCGAIAIMIGQVEISPYLICAGLIFDVFDGLVARWLNAHSELGKQLDSLADLITFGFAPAYLYFLQAPGVKWYYFVGPLIFVMCAALRLGIFNTLPSSKEFIGVPSPAGGIFLLGFLFALAVNNEFVINLIQSPVIYTMIPVVMGFLMVSKFRLLSLKGLNGKTLIPFAIMLVLTGLIMIFIGWQMALSAFVLIYTIVSIVWFTLKLNQ